MLSDIMKVPVLATESREIIREIWDVRHKDDASRAATVLTKSKFDTLASNGKRFRFFTYPVHRKTGVSVFVGQFQAPNHYLFAGLEGFREKGEGANPTLVVTFYDELAKGKDCVLTRGDITDPIITKEEAQQMMELAVRVHTEPELIEYLRVFNDTPREFNYERFFELVKPKN